MHSSHRVLRRWLRANGSLTMRLRGNGHVTVHVLGQAAMPLWPAEQRDLGVRSGHVREVVLLLNGVPVVWARSSVFLRKGHPLRVMEVFSPWVVALATV